MPRHLYVISGASRGLGAALAAQLLDTQHVLLGISRNGNAALQAEAERRGASLLQWTLDLAQTLEAAARLEAWLTALDAGEFASATLVNNAAALTHIGPLETIEASDLSRALRVGLEAPLLLASAFLRATRRWRGERKVFNISSGLGRRAMAGQAPYCAIKAGLDHASRVLALEAAHGQNGAKVVSLAPGVIDTDMQAQLRGADPAAFPDHGLFMQMEREGQLASAQETAARMLAYLRRPDFGRQPIADIREA